jgi:HEAT repeat protein
MASSRASGQDAPNAAAVSLQGNANRCERHLEERARAAAKDLSSDDEDRRTLATAELLRLGERAAPALPELIATLEVKPVELPIPLILGRIGKPAVKPLVAILEKRSDGDRGAAVAALAWMGPPAKDAVPALRAVLESGDSNVIPLAAYALARIDPKSRTEAIDILQKATSGKGDGPAFAAIMIAWLRPADAGPAVAVLEPALQSQSCMFGNLIRFIGAYGLAECRTRRPGGVPAPRP